MVDDHSKANDQLKQVASDEGVTVPDKLSPEDAATKARLEKLSGKGVRPRYMRDMVMDRQKRRKRIPHGVKECEGFRGEELCHPDSSELESHLKDAKSIAPKPTKTALQVAPSKSHFLKVVRRALLPAFSFLPLGYCPKKKPVECTFCWNSLEKKNCGSHIFARRLCAFALALA